MTKVKSQVPSKLNASCEDLDGDAISSQGVRELGEAGPVSCASYGRVKQAAEDYEPILTPKCIDITRDTPLMVYGGGDLGDDHVAALCQDEYNVVCQIDRRAKEIHPNERPVRLLNLEEASRIKTRDTVVLVCVHNALWHEGIVRELVEAGFRYALFAPIGGHFPRDVARRLLFLYTCLTLKNYESLVGIPLLENALDRSLFAYAEDAVARKVGNHVVAWVSPALILTNTKLRERGTVRTRSLGGLPIAGMGPYFDLFRYCEDGSGSIEEYCSAFSTVQSKVLPRDNGSFVSDRIVLHQDFFHALRYGIDYFIDAAPLVAWDTDVSRFVVEEGHHRLVWLMQGGLHELPVLMSRADYDTWLNRPALTANESILLETMNRGWSGFTDHPVMRAAPTGAEVLLSEGLPLLQQRLSQCTSPIEWVVDASVRCGSYARFLTVGPDTNGRAFVSEEQRELALAMNEICGQARIEVLTSRETFMPSCARRTLLIISVDSRRGVPRNTSGWEGMVDRGFPAMLVVEAESDYAPEPILDKVYTHKELLLTRWDGQHLRSLWLLSNPRTAEEE